MKPIPARSRTHTPTGMALAAVLLAALLGPAHADSDRMQPRQVLPAYQQECGSCHLAYPAGMLPASSWRRIMDGLARHYGSDASLDAKATQQISAWLQAHAGNNWRIGQAPAQDRITRTAWFERKHRKIDPAVWQHTSVVSDAPGRPKQARTAARQGEGIEVSAANCAACHADAARGDFDDDSVRIPPGLDKRYLRPFQGD